MTEKEQELQRRLDVCRTNQDPKLDISGLELIKLSNEVSQFIWLTTLKGDRDVTRPASDMRPYYQSLVSKLIGSAVRSRSAYAS